jgi:hypothetical protein
VHVLRSPEALEALVGLLDHAAPGTTVAGGGAGGPPPRPPPRPRPRPEPRWRWRRGACRRCRSHASGHRAG